MSQEARGTFIEGSDDFEDCEGFTAFGTGSSTFGNARLLHMPHAPSAIYANTARCEEALGLRSLARLPSRLSSEGLASDSSCYASLAIFLLAISDTFHLACQDEDNAVSNTAKCD